MLGTFPFPRPLFSTYDRHANLYDTKRFRLPGFQRDLCAQSSLFSS